MTENKLGITDVLLPRSVLDNLPSGPYCRNDIYNELKQFIEFDEYGINVNFLKGLLDVSKRGAILLRENLENYIYSGSVVVQNTSSLKVKPLDHISLAPPICESPNDVMIFNTYGTDRTPAYQTHDSVTFQSALSSLLTACQLAAALSKQLLDLDKSHNNSAELEKVLGLNNPLWISLWETYENIEKAKGTNITNNQFEHQLKLLNHIYKVWDLGQCLQDGAAVAATVNAVFQQTLFGDTDADSQQVGLMPAYQIHADGSVQLAGDIIPRYTIRSFQHKFLHSISVLENVLAQLIYYLKCSLENPREIARVTAIHTNSSQYHHQFSASLGGTITIQFLDAR